MGIRINVEVLVAVGTERVSVSEDCENIILKQEGQEIVIQADYIQDFVEAIKYVMRRA